MFSKRVFGGQIMSFKLPFIKKKEKLTKPYEGSTIPNHVAIIMDGNGRWAKRRGLPRIAGHKEGVDVVQETVRTATKYNVNILTMFAFSTENWKRPRAEVEFIMRLPKQFLTTYLPELIEKNVRVETIGNTDILPAHTKEAIMNAKEKTKNNTGLLLNFAINYGGRDDIVKAVQRVATDINQSKLSVDELDETVFSDYLYTESIADPDLLIRTSGERRISNFLLWQLAYTEFWFTDVLWPDFREEVFIEALEEYERRKRRYGGI